MSVSKQANKEVRPVLERAVRACNEGQTETRKAKKLRKIQILLRIEEGKKRRKRFKELRQEHESRLPVAKVEADGIQYDPAPFFVDSNCATAVAANLEIAFDDNAETDFEEDGDHTSDEPTKSDRQLALIRGEPLPIDDAFFRIDLADIHGSNRNTFDADREFEEILTNCIIKLDPELVKDKAVEYLRDRLETANTINPPVASEESSIEEILEVLHVLNRLSEDAMIRWAFAQKKILLFSSIKRQASENREIPEGNHRVAHLNILEALATRKAGHVSQREIAKHYKAYEKDYNAGKKWVDIAEVFGGYATVILFIVAGVGPWYLTKRFTEYQRDCLEHIAPHLYGVKTLVEALGQNALKKYCRRGYLKKDVIDHIEFIDV